ncbi:MAG: hypothetical protein IT173_15155 [Acidobacteria bacterium]|nr:hypothetical protein [Acidobacteriota bacterium]
MPNQAESSADATRSRSLVIGRGMLALVFLIGACYNALVTLHAPALELQRLTALSPLARYREFATLAATPHPTFLIVCVILFEVSVGLSMFARTELRRLGYLGALGFFVVLAPLLGWYGLTNLSWAVPALLLLRYDRPRDPHTV